MARLRSQPGEARAYGLLVLTLLTVAISAACGGGDESEQGQGQEPIPVRAGARLGWDQTASSRDEVRSLTFRLYVDDAQSTLTDVRCADTPTAAGFACSGVLPTMSAGRHVLTLASVENGAESARSAAIVVELSVSTQLTPPLSPAVDPASSGANSVCSTAPPVACYESALVASGLEPVTALSAAPDGRVFFIEGERRVRVIAGNMVALEPALSLDQADSRVVGLAIDTSFTTTRSVFVAWTDSPAGIPTLNITRYREVQNLFGEGATIVTGLPFRSGALAPLAVDASGLLFVALPSVGGSEPGAIARFTRDGFVPRDNPRSLPAIAEGHPAPTGLGIDRRHGNIWLVGQSPEGGEAIASFAQSANGSWQSRPISVSDAGRQGDDAGLVIGVATRLLRTSSSLEGTPQIFEEVRFVSGSEVLATAEAANGGVYVAIMETAKDRSTSILLLTRQQ
jgi:glucose/arabinose dehydrogenase